MIEGVIGLLTILAAIVRQLMAARARREERTYENDTAKFDQAVAAGNADDLSRMFDELRTPAAGDGDPGGPDDPAAR